MASAQRVQAPFLDTDAALSAADQRLSDDVGDMVELVGSSDWPQTGSASDPEIVAVRTDCG